MKIFRISIPIIFLLLFSYSISNAQTLFFAADESCLDNTQTPDSLLYIVDPETGVINLIGPIGFTGVTGMAVLGDGRLVASARQDEGEGQNRDFISILIEINPFSGQGSFIGVIGNDAGGGCGRAPDLTYDADTNTLYATGFRCGPGDPDLMVINQNTGEGTRIGPTGFAGGGNGLAIRDDGTLFSTPNTSGMNGDLNLITINPQTAQGSLVATNPNVMFVVNALDFHPVTGELFGIENGFGSDGGPPTNLVIVDTSTFGLTRLLELPFCSDALVFINIRTNIPTLSEWGLIAMASVLGIVGFMVVRRRQTAA